MAGLRLELDITGQNTATATLEQVIASISKVQRSAEKASASIKASFESIGRVFEDLSAASRSSATAFSASTDEMRTAASKLQKGVLADFEQIKAGTAGVFAGLGAAAAEGTDAAAAATARMRSAILGDFDTIKTSSTGVFAGLAEGAASAADAASASIDRLGAALETAIGQTKALATELAGVGAESSVAGAGTARGARGASMRNRRGGHGAGGLHARMSTEIPGGHLGGGLSPGVVGAGIGLYSVYEAAKAQDDATLAAITSGAVGDAGKIRQLLMDGASLTAYDIGEVSAAYSKTLQETRGIALPDQQALFKTILPYAATEARLKHTGLAESQEAMVSLSHMAGVYDPAGIKDLSNSFAYYSLSTTAPINQFAKTLSYSLPVLRSGLNMDYNTIMAMTALSQNAGINSTKSGTWLRSFYEGAEPSTSKKHNAALAKLGLLDDDDKVTWRKTGADGKTDWVASTIAIGQSIKDHLAKMDVDDRLSTVKQAFGERGGGIASLMSTDAFLKMLPDMIERMQTSKAGTAALEDYTSNSTVQQARETWRDTQNLLIDIGTTALPAVNAALRDLDAVLKQLPQDWADTMKMWSRRAEDIKQTLTGNRPDLTPEGAKVPEMQTQTWRDWLFGRAPTSQGTPPGTGSQPGASPSWLDSVKGWFSGLSDQVKGNAQQFGQLDATTRSLDGSALILKSSFDGLASTVAHLAGGSGDDKLDGGGIIKASYSPTGDDASASGAGSGGSSRRGGSGGGGWNVPAGAIASGGRGSYGRMRDKWMGAPDFLAKGARESYDFWKSKGLTSAQAAGLVGMEQGESNFDPTVHGDGGTAGGSMQWHRDRRNAILRATGIDVWHSSHADNLRASYYEMTEGGERGFFDRVKRARSAAEAAALGVYGYERPKDKRGAALRRGGFGIDWQKRFDREDAAGVAAKVRPAPSRSAPAQGTPDDDRSRGEIRADASQSSSGHIFNMAFHHQVSDPQHLAKLVCREIDAAVMRRSHDIDHYTA